LTRSAFAMEVTATMIAFSATPHPRVTVMNSISARMVSLVNQEERTFSRRALIELGGLWLSKSSLNGFISSLA
jgi:hypothetical protein